MPNLYHMVPPDMLGDTLFPLNELKNMDSELYERKAHKYHRRKKVMQNRIDLLDCLWNDVVFLTPVHPQKILESYSRIFPGERKSLDFYEIPDSVLDKKRSVIFKHSKLKQQGMLPQEEFIPYDDVYLEQNSDVPQDLLDYFHACKKDGRKPLLFLYTPHVLYHGSIKVADLSRITV